ncbi:Fetuin-B [Myotis brandtii]|uniref:Fetuin-B n=1 Tax=Myotis brandtii TaxID=109478 RepID=S7MES5_MYOBR|nr:Fetuin-B [Myotis brandtii]
MGLLLLLVLCTLAVSCTTRSVPLEVPSHLLFRLRGCNDADMLAMAASVLQDINNDLKEGYVLSLNRDGLGSLFYFTMDVLDTTCHVLSKKPWRDCEERHLHEQVYGKCKALYYVNRPLRILYLPAYNCTLRPDPKVLETATETLAKFNEDSKSGQYSLVKVTKASSQWVFGPSYFVEYLIKESPDIKTEASSSGYQPTDSGKNKSTHSPSKDVLSGSVQYLPDLDDEESQETDPAEAFPVHLDLTTNPQGEPLNVSFLFHGPMIKKLFVLPFPKEEQRSAECPGKASMSNPILLPP